MERKLLYSVIVAGKSAKFTDAALARFLSGMGGDESPFQYINRLISSGQLDDTIRSSRCGNYTKIYRCFREVVALDLFKCSASELEAIHGIGPKTARFFLLWTRPGIRVAALDTHILKWLGSVGYENVPKVTPPAGKRYQELERVFLQEADDARLTPRELDYKIWSMYSGYASEAAPTQEELSMAGA